MAATRSRRCAPQAEAVVNAVTSAHAEVAGGFEKRSSELVSALEQSSRVALDALDTQSAAAMDRIAETHNGVAVAFETRVATVLQAFDGGADEAAQRVADRAQEAVALVAQSHDQLAGRLSRANPTCCWRGLPRRPPRHRSRWRRTPK